MASDAGWQWTRALNSQFREEKYFFSARKDLPRSLVLKSCPRGFRRTCFGAGGMAGSDGLRKEASPRGQGGRHRASQLGLKPRPHAPSLLLSTSGSAPHGPAWPPWLWLCLRSLPSVQTGPGRPGLSPAVGSRVSGPCSERKQIPRRLDTGEPRPYSPPFPRGTSAARTLGPASLPPGAQARPG